MGDSNMWTEMKTINTFIESLEYFQDISLLFSTHLLWCKCLTSLMQKNFMKRYIFILSQLNVFEGITRNSLFLIILVIIIVLQILLVTFTGMAFGVYANFGLTIQQWGICILIGSFSLIVNIILKLLPIAKN